MKSIFKFNLKNLFDFSIIISSRNASNGSLNINSFSKNQFLLRIIESRNSFSEFPANFLNSLEIEMIIILKKLHKLNLIQQNLNLKSFFLQN